MADDPKHPLKNQKHEHFVQLLAQAIPVAEAYVQAGYAPDAANANKVAAKPNIKARLAYLLTPAMRAAGATRERIIKEVFALATSDIRQVVRWGSIAQDTGKETEEGEPIMVHFNDVAFINSSELTDEAAAAIAEVKRSDKGAISIKMHSKLPALELLAKLMQMMAPEKPGDTVNLTQNNTFNITPEQAKDELAEAFRIARRDAEPVDPADDV